MCSIEGISPVVANHFLVLFLALLCILGQLPDALTPDFLAVIFPEQPHLLFIFCLHWGLPVCRHLNLKPGQDQSSE